MYRTKRLIDRHTAKASGPFLRAKAVWGLTRMLACVLVAFAIAVDAPAADNISRHLQRPPKARPGVPSSRVKRGRLDDALEKLSSGKSRPGDTVDVIVMQI